MDPYVVLALRTKLSRMFQQIQNDKSPHVNGLKAGNDPPGGVEQLEALTADPPAIRLIERLKVLRFRLHPLSARYLRRNDLAE